MIRTPLRVPGPRPPRPRRPPLSLAGGRGRGYHCRRMLIAILRNGLVVVSVLLAAAVLSLAAGPMRSASGLAGPTIAQSESPLWAAASLLLLLVPATLLAIVVGRTFTAAVGLFVLGSGISVLSMRCGTIEDLAFAEGSLVATAIEAAVLAGAAAALAAIVFAGSGPLPDQPRRRSSWWAELGDPAGGLAIASGLLALSAVWLVVQTPLKGQAIGGCFLGGVAVGFVGRLLLPRTQPILLFAAPVAAGAAGSLLAAWAGSEGTIATAFVNGTLSRLAYPMPLDWLGGGFCGVAVGIGWSRGFYRAPQDAGDDGGAVPLMVSRSGGAA
jgi:hypothetical protein